MIVIEFKQNTQQVYEKLLSRGFIVAKRPNAEVLRLDPSLTIDKSILDNFIDTLYGVIETESNR
jgi:4-aminobutyrate aminotransferase-like enzyme